MKRRWKILWIVCAVLAAAGIVMVAAGIILGAPIRNTDGERKLGTWLDSIRENWTDHGNGALPEITGKLAELDAESFSSDYTVKAPDGGDILGFDGINELELEVTDIAVFVGTYSGDQVIVDTSRMGDGIRQQIRIEPKGKKLEIEAEGGKRLKQLASDYSAEELSLFISIPESRKMEKITADAGAGCLSMEGISAGRLDVSADAGKIEVSGFSAEKLEAECGAGQITLEGETSEKAKLDCTVGEILYTMPGSRTDYNYKMKCDIGEIEIGGENYGGIGAKTSEDNGSSRTIEAECEIGRIEILFR